MKRIFAAAPVSAATPVTFTSAAEAISLSNVTVTPTVNLSTAAATSLPQAPPVSNGVTVSLTPQLALPAVVSNGASPPNGLPQRVEVKPLNDEPAAKKAKVEAVVPVPAPAATLEIKSD